MPSHENRPKENAPGSGVFEFEGNDGAMRDVREHLRELRRGLEDAVAEVVVGAFLGLADLVEIDIGRLFGVAVHGHLIDVLHRHRRAF